eukprot:jgi/Chrzof1/5281/Cz15g20170.t1
MPSAHPKHHAPVLSHLFAGGHNDHAGTTAAGSTAVADDDKSSQATAAAGALHNDTDDKLLQQLLSTKLKKVQQTLQQKGTVPEQGTDSYETLFTNDQERGTHTWSSLIGVGVVCLVLGGFIGSFAYQIMNKYIQHKPEPRHSISHILDGGNDLEALGESDGLLHARTHHSNGVVHSSRINGAAGR